MTNPEALLFRNRMSAVNEGREATRREWFQGRRWRVLTEWGPRRVPLDNDGVLIIDKGAFWIQGEQVFRTPLGNKGQRGLYVCEVDPETGKDIEPAVLACFGHGALARAQEEFGSVPDLPADRRNPPK